MHSSQRYSRLEHLLNKSGIYSKILLKKMEDQREENRKQLLKKRPRRKRKGKVVDSKKVSIVCFGNFDIFMHKYMYYLGQFLFKGIMHDKLYIHYKIHACLYNITYNVRNQTFVQHSFEIVALIFNSVNFALPIGERSSE